MQLTVVSKMISFSTQKRYTNKKRDEALDYVKGVLIFFVVYGHSLYWMGENIQKPFNFIIHIIYSFHMPLFVFLSGYFFSPIKKIDLSKTLQKKYKRLILPHLFFNLIMIIPIFCFWKQFGHFLTRESDGTITPKSIYLYITMFWYLWCIFLSSIVCNIIYTKISFRPGLCCLSLALLLFTLSIFLPIRIILIHQRMADMLLYFVIGMYAYDYKKKPFKISTQKFYYIPLVIYSIYLCYLCHLNGNISSPTKEFGQLMGIVVFLSFFRTLYRYNFLKRFFLSLSKWTLGIYIYHFVLFYGIKDWYNDTFHYLGNYLIIANLFTTIISTLLISFIANLTNKNSFLRKYALGIN